MLPSMSQSEASHNECQWRVNQGYAAINELQASIVKITNMLETEIKYRGASALTAYMETTIISMYNSIRTIEESTLELEHVRDEFHTPYTTTPFAAMAANAPMGEMAMSTSYSDMDVDMSSGSNRRKLTRKRSFDNEFDGPSKRIRFF